MEKTIVTESKKSPKKLIVTPITKKKLSEHVENELEAMIRRGDWAENEQLPSERELMVLFNVGRPSVREALAGLKRKGLIIVNNGERARVSMPSADTIIGELSNIAKDLLHQPNGITHFEQVREFLEISLIRYAANNATSEQIANLKDALDFNATTLHDYDLFMKSDINFHRIIANIPNNPILLTTHIALLDWLLMVRKPISDKQAILKHNQRSYADHVKIYEQIKNRDADQAEQALRTHLDSVSKIYYSHDKS